MSASAEATPKPSDFKEFFGLSRTQSALSSFLQKIKDYPTHSVFEDGRNSLIAHMIKSFMSSPQIWDDLCQISIESIGNSFLFLLEDEEEHKKTENIDLIFSYCYSFLFEQNLSTAEKLSEEFQNFFDFAEIKFELFSKQAEDQLHSIPEKITISILKRMYGSGAIHSIFKFRKFKEEMDYKLTNWENKLQEYEKKVERLAEDLKNKETAYNFVGLYAGFEELFGKKQKEKKAYAWWTIILGGSIAAILAAKTICILVYPPDARDPLTYLICASVLALIAALIYFFRVALLNFKSVKSQILQIQLRQTLCRFIQSYIEYKQNEKKIEKDTLSMFEKLIFSNIVADDEKIPSTFDGVDHLVSIVKAMKS